MRKIIFVILTFLSGFPIYSYAFHYLNERGVNREITTLIKKRMPTSLVGIYVADDSNERFIYQYNGLHRFAPASNMKLFTAAAALYALGSNYKFSTTISVDAKKINHNTLYGNLYVTFTGDPSLTIMDLKKLLAQIKAKGIDHIQGNIIIDSSRFREPDYAPGWTQDSINWYYSAPITAVALNENAFPLVFLATSKLGHRTEARVDNHCSKYFPLSDNVTAVSMQQANNQCSLVVKMDKEDHLFLSGCWPARKDNSILRISVRNPVLFAKEIIKTTLAHDKVKLQGKVISGKTPRMLKVIANHYSAPLSQLVKTMLKHSNNFYAGCLIKSVGAKYNNENVGSFQNGVLAEKRLLTDKAGVDFKHMSIFDGSGQSYYDHLQPKQIVRLLYHVNHSPIKRTFYQALPISGIDGTLAYRMNNIRGKVHAKTGTMFAGNSSLSGYVITRNNKELVFSILVNGANIHQARHFEDELVSILYHYKGKHLTIQKKTTKSHHR